MREKFAEIEEDIAFASVVFPTRNVCQKYVPGPAHAFVDRLNFLRALDPTALHSLSN